MVLRRERSGSRGIIELTLCQVWSFICTLLWSVACTPCRVLQLGPAHESSLPAHQCFRASPEWQNFAYKVKDSEESAFFQGRIIQDPGESSLERTMYVRQYSRSKYMRSKFRILFIQYSQRCEVKRRLVRTSCGSWSSSTQDPQSFNTLIALGCRSINRSSPYHFTAVDHSDIPEYFYEASRSRSIRPVHEW